MKRCALILAAMAAASPVAVQPAKAEVPVIDAGAIVQLVNQVKWLHDQYEEMTQQLQAVTNGIDLTQVAPGLLTPGMQNPLGGIVGQIPSLIGGATLGNIPGAQQYLQNDRFYQATGGDLRATTLNNSAVSLANLKAIATQMIGANQQRIGQLNGLQNELIGAQDISQVARINGRISLENQTLAAQQAQATQVIEMARLQQQVQEQRLQQRQRADDEQEMRDTAPNTAGAGGGTLQPNNMPTFFGG